MYSLFQELWHNLSHETLIRPVEIHTQSSQQVSQAEAVLSLRQGQELRQQVELSQGHSGNEIQPLHTLLIRLLPEHFKYMPLQSI